MGHQALPARNPIALLLRQELTANAAGIVGAGSEPDPTSKWTAATCPTTRRGATALPGRFNVSGRSKRQGVREQTEMVVPAAAEWYDRGDDSRREVGACNSMPS